MRHPTTLGPIFLLAVACAGSSTIDTQRPTLSAVTMTLDAMEADSVAELQIDLLLKSETSLVAADSLFASGAIVIADGVPKNSAPRLAGVGQGGSVQLVSSRVSGVGSIVWVVLEYRWLPSEINQSMKFGLATVVIGRARDGSWRVLHMHSSSDRPLPENDQPDPSDPSGESGRQDG